MTSQLSAAYHSDLEQAVFGAKTDVTVIGVLTAAVTPLVVGAPTHVTLVVGAQTHVTLVTGAATDVTVHGCHVRVGRWPLAETKSLTYDWNKKRSNDRRA